MKSIFPVLALLMLAACGKEASPDPAPVATAASAAEAAPQGPEVRILAIGDSLFTGYGLAPGQSYPAKLEAALRAKGINARVANAGVSGETTAGGLQRLDFTLDGQASPPALVLISLGGNDMLRGVSPQQTRDNLDALLGKLKQRKIPVLLLGMLSAPNLGADYRAQFDPIYPALARKHGAALVPFFLQSLQGRPELIQADRIHPTEQGIDLLVDSTLTAVEQALRPS